MKTKRDKDNGILLEKETYYTLSINQLQLDIISELTGRISGENDIRKECDQIHKSLYKFSTPNTNPDPLLESIFDGILSVNKYAL